MREIDLGFMDEYNGFPIGFGAGMNQPDWEDFGGSFKPTKEWK